MWFFICCLISVQCCFASDYEYDVTDPVVNRGAIHKVPSFTNALDMVLSINEAIARSADSILVLDFDELLVKGETTRYGEVTVPTQLGRFLDHTITLPEVKEKLRGVLILTARPASSDTINQVLRVTNAELEHCVPNINSFLRSRANFGGALPDFLSYFTKSSYRKGVGTTHSEGFVYHCGLLVMGMARNSKGALRHCKHFTLRTFLKLVPLPATYDLLYADDHKPWFEAFVTKGLGPNVSIHPFHYDHKEAERIRLSTPRPFDQQYAVEPVSGSRIYGLVKCCFTVIVMACMVNQYCFDKTLSILRRLNPVNHFLKIINYLFCKIMFRSKI